MESHVDGFVVIAGFLLFVVTGLVAFLNARTGESSLSGHLFVLSLLAVAVSLAIYFVSRLS